MTEVWQCKNYLKTCFNREYLMNNLNFKLVAWSRRHSPQNEEDWDRVIKEVVSE